MKEREGSILNSSADGVVVTLNRIIKKDGTLVMGAGQALYFARMYPELPKLFADQMNVNKEDVCWAKVTSKTLNNNMQQIIIGYPTKDSFKEKASLTLIEQYAYSMVTLVNLFRLRYIELPRLGCNLGKLDWETEVKPKISKILDDRFTVVHSPKKEWVSNNKITFGHTVQNNQVSVGGPPHKDDIF